MKKKNKKSVIIFSPPSRCKVVGSFESTKSFGSSQQDSVAATKADGDLKTNKKTLKATEKKKNGSIQFVQCVKVYRAQTDFYIFKPKFYCYCKAAK